MIDVAEREQCSPEELHAVRELWDACNLSDGTVVKVNWDMLKDRRPGQAHDFLWRERGELLGFASLYQFRSDEIEFTGMVHPDHRRQGGFRALFAAAASHCRRRNSPRMLAICPSGSESGHRFLSSVNGTYRYSEHTMYLQAPPDYAGTPGSAPDVELRLAGPAETTAVADLIREGFGMSEADALEYAAKPLYPGNVRTFAAEANGRIVGTIRIVAEEGEQAIYGFVVASDLRGSGIGTEMLRRVIALADRGMPIKLEVAADNARAFRLYERCGFRKAYGQDYVEVIY